ncbi:chalcone isomerase-like protein [Klebsormidium nitens]|uniref:Chalcone-flavonone isomerase family protein n=1 Tax=Klebsormidium nitens TaxID=105231 RepID=A0A1Y1IDB9_KLENI|nr:chalcone isomerase-like protein [Klebsormidium nitens]|eukprot:GAQ88583.1 chalcone isomerase-like protein [Klebsormidium nitens]
MWGGNVHKEEAGQSRRLHWRQGTSKPGAIVATAEAAVETKMEPATGVKFAKQSVTPGSDELELLGAGVREKKVVLVNVKVYAVAFYVGDRGIHKLGPWRHTSADQLKKDENFYKLLADGDFAKQLQIVLARDVTGDQFYGALEEALAPRVAAAGAGADGQAAMGQFGNVFKGKSLKKGTGIFLSFEKPDILHIGVVDDASTLQPPENTEASIASGPLIKALFDVFLGPNAVSPSLRESIADGAAEFLA